MKQHKAPQDSLTRKDRATSSKSKKQFDLIDAVFKSIQRRGLIPPRATVIVGVSGGPDSLVLLHCLLALRDELKINLHIAHLNHQLRGTDSDQDMEFVREIAQDLQTPATIESRDVRAFAREQRISIEEGARRVRYAFLAEVAWRTNAPVIAVAHHRDDQVETVLMHLIRGAGLAGLRGMQHKAELRGVGFGLADLTGHPPLYLVRPLLDVTRAEIEEFARQHHLTARTDHSNSETVFFRNRLRSDVLPYLETVNPNLRQVLFHSSMSIGDDYDFLNSASEEMFALIAHKEQGVIVFRREVWRALHPSLQRGTLRIGIRELNGDLRDLGWIHIEEARRIALEKGAGAQAPLPGNLRLFVGYDQFVIADPSASFPLTDIPLLHKDLLPLPTQGVIELPDSDWDVETKLTTELPTAAGPWTAVLDFDRCRGERYLRRRSPGDRFQPVGMSGRTRSLHEFMIDEKVERSVRALLPLLMVDERIAWVCGFRLDERSCPTPATSEFWLVSFRKRKSL